MLFSHFSITEAASNRVPLQLQKKTIIIDPGHGGHDIGAQGPDGTFEKTVTMELARSLASELEYTYKVILTRTDDYWVDILTRTSTGNHQSADMFISLHSGGSFLHQASGISLYYHKKMSNTLLTFDEDSNNGLKNINTQALWSDIQKRHQQTSKALAEMLSNRMNEPAQFKIEIQGVPLMVLEGADMPAVLIEVGYITNPAEEKLLKDINFLSDVAKKIKRGIDDFFEKFP